MFKFAFTFFFFISFFCFAQNAPVIRTEKSAELFLIAQHEAGEIVIENKLNTKTALQTKHHNALAKYNPVTLSFSGLMLFYQHIVSPQLNATCVYSRSCSNFAKQAILEYGIIKGVFLTADRLMRCNAHCENDIPPYSFETSGKAIDEPFLYRFK